MSFRTSFSQNSTFINCSRHWYLSYIQKWESPVIGASLYFGSAMDAGVTTMLEGKSDWLNVFKDRWHKAYSFGTATPVYDNPEVVYGHKDFDEYVLEPKDIIKLEQYIIELGLHSLNPIELYKDIAARKKNPYKTISDVELRYFNRASWLSMRKKGELLLNKFHTDFYPKITKVVSTQQRGSIVDQATGDSIVGYIDMVLEIQGYDKPIIFDLKTAAQPYKQEDIDLTQQLTLYSAMKGADYNTDLVGYVVLCKNIPKEDESYCSVCNHKKNGRHATCDNVNLSGVRCGGKWVNTKVCKPEIQVLVQQKNKTQIDDLLTDSANIILAMKNGIHYKDTSKCANWWGSKCPFFDACHKGDFSALRRKK
jgi:hypothetical protein